MDYGLLTIYYFGSVDCGLWTEDCGLISCTTIFTVFQKNLLM